MDYTPESILAEGPFKDWQIKYTPLNILRKMAKSGDQKMRQFLDGLSYDEKWLYHKNCRKCTYPKPETWDDGPLCRWWPGMHIKKTSSKEVPIFRIPEKIETPAYRYQCRKIPFLDLDAAKKELKRIRKMPTEYNNHKIPVRAYECPVCGLFHLTSKK